MDLDNIQINNNLIYFKKNNRESNNIIYNKNNKSFDNDFNGKDLEIDYNNCSELSGKKIKQLGPNQDFPLTWGDISENNCLSSLKIRYQLKENQIIKMENEIKNLKNKCLILEENNKQMAESREKILQSLKEQKHLLIFPPPERIPCEKLYDGYSKLYEAYNKLLNDKEVAVVSLQNEILVNDQQRNYIEILKQVLESSLLKNGIKSQIEMYKKIQKKTNEEYTTNLIDNKIEYYEELFNVVKLNKQIEDLYKLNNILELENNKLLTDIKDVNNRNNIFREQINNSLKNGIEELQQAKYKIKELESEKEKLIEENNIIKNYNNKLELKINNFHQENFNLNSKTVKDNGKNNYEINDYINKYEEIHTQFQLIKNDYEQVKNINGILKKENQEEKEQISILKQENEALINEINNMKNDYNRSKTNQFQSFSNNNHFNDKTSLNSISIKANSSTLTGEKFFDITNNNNSISDFNKTDINKNKNSKNFSNTNLDNLINELIKYIYNCLINSNEFIKFCFSKYKENEYIEEELKENEVWNNFINNITALTQLFQECYNLLIKYLNNNSSNNNMNSNLIKSPKNKILSNLSSTKDKTYDDIPPLKMTLSNTVNDSFNNNTNSKVEYNNKEKSLKEAINKVNINNNINNEELLIELEKYKEDNKIIYKNYKKLENENIELFFVNKENKFYYKLISRLIQYHISNIDVKAIINKLVLINGKAISLDMEKSKIKIKIDDISCSLTSSSSLVGINSKYFYENELFNSEELDKLKKRFAELEKELNEKYIALKNLDKELKSYESVE